MPTVASAPPTFALGTFGVIVSFAIPVGVWSAAVWVFTGSCSVAPAGAHIQVSLGGDTVALGALGVGPMPVPYEVLATPAQLADINAAAGGSLSVATIDMPMGGAGAVTGFTLVLTAGPPPPVQQPQWAFGFQAVTGFNPAPGLNTPCGNSVSASGPNASPAALTVSIDLGISTAVSSTDTFVFYAGTSVEVALDSSPDGVTWTNEALTNLGSDHVGVYSAELITLAVPVTTRYYRMSYQEVPQVGAASLMQLSQVLFGGSAAPIYSSGDGGTEGWCSGGSGVVTISGAYTRGLSGIPRENTPITLFVKTCCSPMLLSCAHGSPLATGSGAPSPCPSTNGSGYCSDGTITAIPAVTDCSGNYSVTASGVILAVGIAIGTWTKNPAYTCCTPQSVAEWIPTQPYCGVDVTCSGSATALSGSGVITDGTGGFTDGSNSEGDGFFDACPGLGYDLPQCEPCHGTGGCIWTWIAEGITNPGFGLPGGIGYPIAQTLSGAYTLNIEDHADYGEVLTFYQQDGKFYVVSGVVIGLTDACGLTESDTTNAAGIHTITTVDWPNITAVTVGNWDPSVSCSYPLGVDFAGPAGGTLHIYGPYASLPIRYQALIYPSFVPALSSLCPVISPVLGIILNPTCTGTVADRLAVDTRGDVLALSWVTAGALKTAVHRSPSQVIGGSTGDWEATNIVEAANADQIGLGFLPNDSLYLTYLLSGVAKYRINPAFGANGLWSAAAAPSPLVGGPGHYGRGQEQAHRFRALGSPSANGNLQFSQCRDSLGALWTAPVVVSFNAGPYCGGAFVENLHICLFTPAVSVAGHVAAGYLYSTQSLDGGATWSAPLLIGYGSAGGLYCNGIVKTAQGVLVAVTWDSTAHTTGFLVSRNQGAGWQAVTTYAPVPILTKPPVLAAMDDLVFCCWVTGEQPQFLCSQDGGITFR